MDESLYAAWLAHGKGLHRRMKKQLVDHFGTVRGVFEASDEAWIDCLAPNGQSTAQRKMNAKWPKRDLCDAERILQRAIDLEAHVVPYTSHRYPAWLRTIPDPPMVLYARGDVSLMSGMGIAVVGTRKASPYGRWAARKIGSCIASCGVPVISGMAEGIDSEAHTGCLDEGTGTVAVLGTGLAHCFPASNRGLFRRICERGLAVSEFPPDERGFASHFPLRNRVISGLSRAVIVVEGAEKSGSMITAGLAAEQGRDVFSVPGNINQPHSKGTNRLICDGAYPILDVEELPEVLGLVEQRKQRHKAHLSPEEADILRAVERAGYLSMDELYCSTNLQASHVASLVTILELKGLLRMRTGKIEVAK